MTPSAAQQAPAGEARDRAFILVLVLISTALYLPNLNDYFLSDDFDLIRSFYGKPPGYFVKLLIDNESGVIWESLGLSSELGRGYLRPVKIWFLKLDSVLWGTNPLGFHLTSTAFFVGSIILVFQIARQMLTDKPALAFLAAATVAIHPVFSEIVPSINAREELIAAFFGLWCFHAFLKHRLHGRSPAAFYVFYGLALLTKESAISVAGFAVGFDLVHGRLTRGSSSSLREAAKLYAPIVLMLAVYLGMRWVAFGNVRGGEAYPTHYLSPTAFLEFNARFYNSLFDRTMLFAGDLPGMRLIGGCMAAGAIALGASKIRQIGGRRLRDLLFFGPLWYLCSISALFGTYFTPRHNILPLVGLALFGTLLLDTILRTHRVKRHGIVAAVALAALALLLTPATLETAGDYDAAGRTVGGMRAEIEQRAAELPPGSSVLLVNVPQWEVPPYYFGWGLLSALKRPFTETDLATVSTVINRKNIRMNRYRVPVPEKYDLVLTFKTRDWISAESLKRSRARWARDAGPVLSD